MLGDPEGQGSSLHEQDQLSFTPKSPWVREPKAFTQQTLEDDRNQGWGNECANQRLELSTCNLPAAQILQTISAGEHHVHRINVFPFSRARVTNRPCFQPPTCEKRGTPITSRVTSMAAAVSCNGNRLRPHSNSISLCKVDE